MPTATSVVATQTPRNKSIRTIKEWIDTGKIPLGEPLPTEAELVKLLSVSRTTVRAALRALESDGTIRSNDSRRKIPIRSQRDRAGVFTDAVCVLSDPSRTGLKQRGFNFYIEMSATDALRRAGNNVLNLKSSELELEAMQQLRDRPPLGILVLRDAVTSLSESAIALLLEIKAPIVVYSTGEQFPAFDTVATDHAAGAAELTRWLIKRGRKSILPLRHRDLKFPHTHYWFAARLAGYQRAMHEARLTPLDPVDIWFTPDQAATKERFESECRLAAGYLEPLLGRQKTIDGIMTLSDDRTFSVAEACRQLGATPHENIDIVGYDNYWMDFPDRNFTDFTPLASVDKQNLLIGEKLAELMLRRIQGDTLPKPQHWLVAPQLITYSKTAKAHSDRGR